MSVKEAQVETVTLLSPQGSNVTVSARDEQRFLSCGYSKVKRTSTRKTATAK